MSWLLDYSVYVPRMHCGAWPAWQAYAAIVADVLIGFAYVVIPWLLYVQIPTRTRRDRALSVFFMAFIFACGITHFSSALMFWIPVYRFDTLLRILTACISLWSAQALWASVKENAHGRRPGNGSSEGIGEGHRETT